MPVSIECDLARIGENGASEHCFGVLLCSVLICVRQDTPVPETVSAAPAPAKAAAASGPSVTAAPTAAKGTTPLSAQIAGARQQIRESLAVSNDSASSSSISTSNLPVSQLSTTSSRTTAITTQHSSQHSGAAAGQNNDGSSNSSTATNSNKSKVQPCAGCTRPPRAGSVVRHANSCPAVATPQPLPTNAKKKRRNRNRSRRKRSKSARASSCCQSVSPGRMSVASNVSLPPQAQGV